MKILIIFYMVSCMSVWVFGQQTISCKIVDKKTYEPIESAIITVMHSSKKISSNAEGNFNITMPNDSCLVSVSMIGYRSQSIKINKRATNICYLERGAVDLKEIIIASQASVSSFHNLTAIDLNMRPVNSSQDLMRLVPGLFLGLHQGGGIAEHIFFRGFDADHGTDVNVSVDGMPLNLVSHAHGQGFADLHFLIPELVNKYEFGKGPYYTSYGDFATAGYVSFKTYDALNNNEVKIEGGRFATGRIMTAINLLSDKAKQHGENAYIAAEDAYTNGPYNLPQHFNRFNLFGKYNRIIFPKTKMSITLSIYASDWKSSGEIPERAVSEGITDRFGYIDSAQGGSTSRTNAIIKFSSALHNNTGWKIKSIIQNTFSYCIMMPHFLLMTASTETSSGKENQEMYLAIMVNSYIMLILQMAHHYTLYSALHGS